MSEEKIICPKCGTENKNVDNFCAECGAPLKNETNQGLNQVPKQKPKPKMESKSYSILLKVIIFAVIPIVWICFMVVGITDMSSYQFEKTFTLGNLGHAIVTSTVIQVLAFSTIIVLSLINLWLIVYYTHKFSNKINNLEKHLLVINKKIK